MLITDTGLYNEPIRAEKDKLLYLCQYILQPIRDKWGALRVTSGFRSVPVNVRIGGASTSQHVKGEAADFVPAAGFEDVLDDVFEWIVKESKLKFGQCIREGKGGKDWIHISLPRLSPNGGNQQALVFKDGVYHPYV